MKADTADRFNAGARTYAELWAPVLLPHGHRLLAELPLADARRVLEIAAGVGSLLPSIRAAAPRAQVVGVDLARSMIALAPSGFDLAVMDAARLAVADATFDAAVMAFALFFVPDPHAALAEARRILRPGGALGLTTWNGEPHFPAHDSWLAEVTAAGIAGVSWSPDAIEPDALTRALASAGFKSSRLFFQRFDHRHDPERFLRLRIALAAPRLASLSSSQRAAFLSRVRMRLGALSADDYVDPTEIIFAVAKV